jgi:uracil-DNA glycosylase
VPDPGEIATCSRWLTAEIEILRPALVIPIGRLAIAQFIEFEKLTDVIGKAFRATSHGRDFDVIPLPHPSGASPWHRMEPGKSLLDRALKRIVQHEAWTSHRAY